MTSQYDEDENEQDKNSYHENELDDKEFIEKDQDETISDVWRTENDAKDGFLQWDKVQCLELIEEDNTNIKAHFRLGMLHMEDKEFDEAKDEFLDHCIKIDKSFRKGQAYEFVGD
jgi:hypothetical protein